jgi:predicted dehydrogenase
MRVAFAGLGQVVTGLHLPAWRRLTGTTLVAGSDPSSERRLAWTRATGAPAFATADEMLAATEPDVVVVATPPDSHAELSLAALARGAHLICEKPLATTVEDADRVLAAAGEAGRGVAVNHHFRYQPIFSAVRERVASGEDGRLVLCQLSQLMLLPPWEEADPWRAEMADRALLEGGVHLVDLSLFLFGRAPEAVSARCSGGVEEGRTGADAIWAITLDFGSGALATLTINRLSPAATRFVELRADCERASLRASFGGRALLRIGKERAARGGVRLDWAAEGLAWSEQGLSRKVLARNPRRASVRATAALLEEALSAFSTGREPLPSVRQAREGLAVIEGAYRSARTGATAPLRAGALADHV